MGKRICTLLFLLAMGVLLGACAPNEMYKAGEATIDPSLTPTELIVADGTRLPLRSWGPEVSPPTAVLLAVHGFNDYSGYFKETGEYLANKYGVLSYAIDQRGFGEAPPKLGIWAGKQTYANDVKSAAIALNKAHPGLPLYLLGTSMGGGVVMIAMTDADAPKVDGIVLSAPAVWGRVTMPWYQRLALWVGAHTLPDLALSGQGLKIRPSDNIEMLIAFSKDPLVIKETRIGTIYGLVNLMDLALQRSEKLTTPALILYGEHDEVIPKPPTARMFARLPKVPEGQHRIALYQNGYHMLLRDLQRETVWKDIGAWVQNQQGPLPSGADLRDVSLLAKKD